MSSCQTNVSQRANDALQPLLNWTAGTEHKLITKTNLTFYSLGIFTEFDPQSLPINFYFLLNNLFLVVLDGKFKSAQVHALLQQASLVNMILAGGVIKNHFQLPRVSSLSQQILGKHLALLRQLLIVIPRARELDAISVHKCFSVLSITGNIFVCTCIQICLMASQMVKHD